MKARHNGQTSNRMRDEVSKHAGSTRQAPDDDDLLQQIVGNLAEGLVLVDQGGSITWANTAALDIHGCTQLPELLLDASSYRRRFALRYRNHHKLRAKQYPLARLAAREAFDELTVVLSRPDLPDFERVVQMQGLLIKDRQRESAALIIRDVSEHASAEERFERTFASNPAPAVILCTTRWRYVKVNRGFLEMTAYSSDEIIDRPFRELDVLHQAEHRDEALDALREHRTIAQQEALLRVKDGSQKFVIIAGQPIDYEGATCMLFTFNDLDKRKLAETSLRSSEESFRKAFRLAPVPMLICDEDSLRIVEFNDAFATVSGRTDDELGGMTLAELCAGPCRNFPERIMRALQAHIGVRDEEIRLRAGNGTEIDCVFSAEPVSIGARARVLCVVQDITERKRSESDLYQAIEAVMQDTSWFSRTIIEKLAQVRQVAGTDRGLDELTAREREVLELLCKGHSNTQIAAQLDLSTNTVRNHVATLYSKMGVNRRSAAVIWGRERGLAAY